MKSFAVTDPGLPAAFWEAVSDCPAGCAREALEVREHRDPLGEGFRIRCRACDREGPGRTGPRAALGAWNALPPEGPDAQPPPAFEPWWVGEEARP